MLNIIKSNKRDIFLVILFAFTIYSVHLLNIYKIWGPNENAVIGLLSTIVFLIVAFHNRADKKNINNDSSITIFEKIIFTTGGSLICIAYLQSIIAAYPMDKTNSDVIPQINVLVGRFLSGTYPYTSIDFKIYTLFPTYLPLQWLPFCIAELFKIDYRTFALVVLLIPVAVFLSKFRNRFVFYTASFLVYGLYVVGMLYNKDDYFNCVENIIAAFYLTFALSLLYSKNIWIQVLFLSFCLFSRYSIVIWVPLYFIYLFANHGLLQSIKAAGLLFLIFLTVYGFPFLMKDTSIFMQAYKYHTNAAIGEWSVNSTCKNCKPYHLDRGLGMAIFFYENQDTITQRLKLLQKIHIILSTLTVAVSTLYILLIKYLLKQNISTHFLLWSLAMYLTIFYQFIQIPYHYLFSVPVFVYLVLFKSYFNKVNN